MSPAPTAIAEIHTQQVRHRILRNVFMHQNLTRRDIGRLVSLSGGAVTHHTRWLKDQRLVRIRRKRVASSNRPVEEFSIDGRRGRCLTLRVQRGAISAELVSLDGRVLESWGEAMCGFTQAEVFRALERAAVRAHEGGAAIDAASLMVSGHVSPRVGMIFDVEGIEGEWDPSQPWYIIDALRRIPTLRVRTDAACKVRGLGGRLCRDDGIAYFERQGEVFRLANMERGQVHYGEHGSSSALFHQSVAEEGPPCYCGRRGCLYAYLRVADPPHELLAAGLKRVFDRVKATAVGVEWEAQAGWMKSLLEGLGIEVHPIEDAETLSAEGLRALAIEEALRHKLEGSAAAGPSNG